MLNLESKVGKKLPYHFTIMKKQVVTLSKKIKNNQIITTFCINLFGIEMAMNQVAINDIRNYTKYFELLQFLISSLFIFIALHEYIIHCIAWIPLD